MAELPPWLSVSPAQWGELAARGGQLGLEQQRINQSAQQFAASQAMQQQEMQQAKQKLALELAARKQQLQQENLYNMAKLQTEASMRQQSMNLQKELQRDEMMQKAQQFAQSFGLERDKFGQEQQFQTGELGLRQKAIESEDAYRKAAIAEKQDELGAKMTPEQRVLLSTANRYLEIGKGLAQRDPDSAAKYFKVAGEIQKKLNPEFSQILGDGQKPQDDFLSGFNEWRKEKSKKPIALDPMQQAQMVQSLQLNPQLDASDFLNPPQEQGQQ
jgi:hypothetical protein